MGSFSMEQITHDLSPYLSQSRPPVSLESCAAAVLPLIRKLAVSAIGGLLCCLSVEELKEVEGEWEGAH